MSDSHPFRLYFPCSFYQYNSETALSDAAALKEQIRVMEDKMNYLTEHMTREAFRIPNFSHPSVSTCGPLHLCRRLHLCVYVVMEKSHDLLFQFIHSNSHFYVTDADRRWDWGSPSGSLWGKKYVIVFHFLSSPPLFSQSWIPMQLQELHFIFMLHVKTHLSITKFLSFVTTISLCWIR